MSAAELGRVAADDAGDGDDPRIYLACPLTGLDVTTRRQLDSDVCHVKHAVEALTFADRPEAEQWPVSVYAPIDHTAPWAGDHLSPTEVFARNLSQVHNADALIVLAENGGSAGVGQEIEWAVRLGIPVAFLAATDPVSRQIAGSPGLISPLVYNNDLGTLTAHVSNFLRRFKPLILDGPRRRQARTLAFTAITLRLRGAWQSCHDPTGVAAQLRVDIAYLDLYLSDPRYIATMPVETLLALARELDISLHSLDTTPAFTLPVDCLRPLLAAATEHGWPDSDIKRLLHLGRAELGAPTGIDLRTLTGWKQLRDGQA